MFEHVDAILLARIQFAFTVAFHFLLPAFTIGLASYLAVLNGLWLRTGRSIYLDLFRYWSKIFAVAFAMGVVSGIVMSYQFGTNWSVFADKAGPVLGAPMAYEVLSAFFLEAGFLGIMLFGRDRVGPKLHMFATVMVALGTLASAFWILSVNSWMHTPAGYSIDPETGQFLPEDWWAIIFNPSFPYRLMHTVTGAYLTTAFIVAGVGAWHLLRNRRNLGARTMFSMAMWMIAVLAPTQIVLGDLHGLQVIARAALVWLIFKTGLRVFGFDPSRYRREMVENTDFRKFDDALMITVDCAPDVAEKLRALLDKAVAEGAVRYGLHMQDEALITCIAPSVRTSDHMHFVDGGDGGYAAAAAQLR